MPAPLVTPLSIARRYLGLQETPGPAHTAAVVAMLQRVDRSVRGDETAWCSAFVDHCAWLCELPTPKSLRARAWLRVGFEIPIAEAQPGYDLCVFTRGLNMAPATVEHAPGHVALFVKWDSARRVVAVLGGNQANQVSVAEFPIARLLGVRRLVE